MSSKARAGRSQAAKKQPLAFSNALGDFAGSIGITKKLREYSVITSWSAIVGEQIAKVATPQRIENRVLFVAVASAPWRSELTLRRRDLIERINASVGKQVVVDIRFR